MRSSPASPGSPSGPSMRGPRNQVHEPWLQDTRETQSNRCLIRGLSSKETVMPSRRTFLSLLGGSAIAPQLALAQRRSQQLALYANVGPVLMHYDVDPAEAELIKRGSVILPAAVQYCWPHRDRRHFYVASSNTTPRNPQTATEHY